MSLLVLRGASVLLPDGWAEAEIWTLGRSITGIGEPAGPDGEIPGALGVPEVVDLAGERLVPGFIDSHLHILGGGGGGGFPTRIPELPVDAALEAGITTCVAMPGVDPLTRPLRALLALAASFREQGVRALPMTGGFVWPTETLTGSVRSDLHTIPSLTGVKIALGEHLATAPTAHELERLLVEIDWAAHTTGRGILLHAHLGTAAQPAARLEAALEAVPVDRGRVQVTHANYTRDTLDAAIRLGLAGCRIDVNPLIRPDRIGGAIAPTEAIAALLGAGVALDRLSLSTDGNASVPRTLTDGTPEGFSHQLGLARAVGNVVAAGVLDAAAALQLITANPAAALRRHDLGRIARGAAADLVGLDDEFAVRTVISGGVVRVREGRALAPSMFRDPRWSTA